jgi:hypothetical protein
MPTGVELWRAAVKRQLGLTPAVELTPAISSSAADREHRLCRRGRALRDTERLSKQRHSLLCDGASAVCLGYPSPNPPWVELECSQPSETRKLEERKLNYVS